MKRGGGFTLVELMITITIMVILMTLATLNLLSAQTAGRDQERQTDISTLARGLEVYYLNGNAYASIPKGYYPGAQEVTTAASATPPFANFLEGVATASYEAPNSTAVNSFRIDPNYASSAPGSNADGSYSDSQARALLATIPYLYQPLTRNNTFCTGYANCVKFNLYYLNEANNTVQKVGSKNQ